MIFLKINEEKFFKNRLKFAERNLFCICVDVCQKYDGNEYDKVFEVLSTLKN